MVRASAIYSITHISSLNLCHSTLLLHQHQGGETTPSVIQKEESLTQMVGSHYLVQDLLPSTSLPEVNSPELD